MLDDDARHDMKEREFSKQLMYTIYNSSTILCTRYGGGLVIVMGGWITYRRRLSERDDGVSR